MKESKSPSLICSLGDGTRVRYSLLKRDRDPYFLVCFRGPQKDRKELTTKESNKKRATESALALILKEYQPKTVASTPTWETAIAKMVEAMAGKNLRPHTVKSYKEAVSTLRALFPGTLGPGEISSDMANQYKLARLRTCSPQTVRGDLNEINIVFRKWWIKTCKILVSNPFAGEEPPKVDRKEPRILSSEEQKIFFDWMRARWDGWRLPLLLLEIKVAIGCRIAELTALPTKNLQDGRVVFESDSTKGRRTRRLKLPIDLNRELIALAGPTFAWEKFSEQLKVIHLKRGRPDHASSLRGFTPTRLAAWLDDEVEKFRKANPQIPYFKLHNLRGTAMSLAKEGGASYEDAAIAFGCHPETMRRHYVTLDETAISDGVMDRIKRRNNGEEKNDKLGS